MCNKKRSCDKINKKKSCSRILKLRVAHAEAKKYYNCMTSYNNEELITKLEKIKKDKDKKIVSKD